MLSEYGEETALVQSLIHSTNAYTDLFLHQSHCLAVQCLESHALALHGPGPGSPRAPALGQLPAQLWPLRLCSRILPPSFPQQDLILEPSSELCRLAPGASMVTLGQGPPRCSAPAQPSPVSFPLSQPTPQTCGTLTARTRGGLQPHSPAGPAWEGKAGPEGPVNTWAPPTPV